MNRFMALLVLSFACARTALAIQDLPSELNQIKLRPGFHIEVLMRLPDARGMALAPSGTLFVGSMEAGKVYAITRDHLKPLKVYTLLEKLNRPIGVAYQDGALYTSSVDRILRIPDVEKHLEKPATVIVTKSLPPEEHHGGRYLAFGPDHKLYIGIGAPCNVCDRGDAYANISRMNPDGSNFEVFAKGIRNSVGFDWHPGTHELWFTDNGRDLLGDDVPPDELNRAPKVGLHFGFPFCHGSSVPDPDFGKGKNCKDYVKPEQALSAHVASLGMRFYTGKMFPPEYQHRIFVAEHGSWNRSKKIGYRVMMATLEGNKVKSYTPFAEGWLKGEEAWGRPVDVLVDQDGALLVSDDEAGAIYRISYAPVANKKIAH